MPSLMLGGHSGTSPSVRRAPRKHAIFIQTSVRGNNTSVILAKSAKKENAGVRKRQKGLLPPKKRSAGRGPLKDEEEEEEEVKGFGFFNASLYNKSFNVPWGGGTVALGMIGWAVSFIGVGLIAVPLAYKGLGLGPLYQLSSSDKAIYTLVNQSVETVVGIGLVRAIALRGKAKAEEAAEEEEAANSNKGAKSRGGRRGEEAASSSATYDDELFKVSLSNPFRRPDGWAVWGLLGLALAPLSVFAVATVLNGVGYHPPSGRGTVDAVAKIIELDDITFASLFGTTAILAPILEEYVFRGFLLVSLTKYMPTWTAVIASAGCFGLAHLSPRDFPQLFTLGIILGFTYVRSRNLLTSMFIHGAWNGTVLTALFILVAAGVDLEELLKEIATTQ